MGSLYDCSIQYRIENNLPIYHSSQDEIRAIKAEFRRMRPKWILKSGETPVRKNFLLNLPDGSVVCDRSGSDQCLTPLINFGNEDGWRVVKSRYGELLLVAGHEVVFNYKTDDFP